MNKLWALILVCVCIVFHSAYALTDPAERLKDPVLEARALALTRTIRCVVCQNQSIDESNAAIAQDMRRLIREQISLGQSDADIENYIVIRYGDYVRLNPRITTNTVFLWAGPFLLLILAAFSFAPYIRLRKGNP